MERKLEEMFPGRTQDISISPFAFSSDTTGTSDRSLDSSPDECASFPSVVATPAASDNLYGSQEITELLARFEAEKSNAMEPRLALASVGMPLAQPNWNDMTFPGGLRNLPNWIGGINNATPPVPPNSASSDVTCWMPWTGRKLFQEATRPQKVATASPQPAPRTAFEVPTVSSPQKLEVKPVLRIVPNKATNFVRSQVYFVIQCYNFPNDVELKEDMLDAIVENPAKASIPCRVRRCDSFRTFLGDFAAGAEAGDYDVKVRLVIPMKMWSATRGNDSAASGVFTETSAVPVSRSYFKDAETDSLLIHCEFQIPEAAMRTPSPHNPGINVPCKLWGLACDLKKNNLFYTDRASHEVICISPSGDILLRFGRNGTSEEGRLNRPTGIACDNANNRLIVSDKDNHRIVFFTLEGQFISSVGGRGHSSGLFHYPWDVAVSRNGDHFVVADSRNKRIQLFDRFGNFIHKFSVFETNPFEYKQSLDYPRGICFDDSGNNIYVTDFNQHNILKFPLDLSRFQKLVPEGKLRRPQGIAVDQLGNLLVTDSRNNSIRHVTHKGDLLATIRHIKSSPVDFPVNICTMSGGYVAVLDGNGKIRIF